MKLVRFGDKGREKPGLVDAAGAVRDLSGVVDDIAGAALSAAGLATIAALDPASLPLAPSGARLGPCVGRVGKIVCIGRNYAEHAKETGSAVPTEPLVFMKATSALNGPNDAIVQPRGSSKLDWEVELAIVIGREAAYVSEADALDYVAGFCVMNDVSERAFQNERGGQFTKGKSADSFAPLGPWLVTRDEAGDVDDLALWCEINSVRMQDGRTRDMIFKPAFLISYLSHFMRFEPGDVISTGTPSGVGLGQNPPLFLKSGDRVRIGVAGLGEQAMGVVAAG